MAAEDSALAEETDRAGDAAAHASERQESAERRLASAEADLAEAQAAASDLNARRHALGAAAAEEGRRLARLEAECAGIERERAALRGAGFEDAEHATRALAVADLGQALETAERETLAAEESHALAREAEARSRGPLDEAERAAQKLETEARTLASLVGSDANSRWPPVVDAISVERGYEAALGAALGDDLDASVEESAPAHWSLIAPEGEDPPMPPGAEPLAERVVAPQALARGLAQVGVVAREDGKWLSRLLRPGQRLVSREGDLWRWDGFVAAAEAPTPAARRLAERNRLGDLQREAEAAPRAVEAVRIDAAGAAARAREAAAAEADRRQRVRAAQSGLRQRPRRARRFRAQARADHVSPFGGRGSRIARQSRARRGGRAQAAGGSGASGSRARR